MTVARLLEESAEDLFENAPCGYLSTRMDGTIVRVNRTLEAWTGRQRSDMVGKLRFQDLLTPGGRIYHETHYAPLLRMQGSVNEIAVELLRADGSRIPALVNSVLRQDEHGVAQLVRTTVFDATDRRRYEQELLRAQRREHEVASQLAESLMPGALPERADVELSSAYRPALADPQVGGDWYDAFWIGPDRIGLTVGDVVGRGLEAAATMGQLRSAVRALAVTGLGPGRLLDALDAYARRHSIGQMATVVHAELDLATGALCYACAGHPPPVVATPGAGVEVLLEGRSVPLDLHSGSTPARAEHAATLAPGAVLVLYTDGLVERRKVAITDGIDLLARVLNGRVDAPMAGLADGLVDELCGTDRTDDVCVLAARRSG